MLAGQIRVGHGGRHSARRASLPRPSALEGCSGFAARRHRGPHGAVRHWGMWNQMRSSAPTRFRDHYAILGVPADAGEAEIKAAYREKAKQCHPDLNPGDAAAAERFRMISEARRVL